MHVVEHRDGRLGEPSRGIESPCKKKNIVFMEQTPLISL